MCESIKCQTFKVEREVSYADLWEAIWGSDGAGMTYWCDKVRQADGGGIDFFKYEDGKMVSNPQDFMVRDYHDEQWHTVTLEDLAEAFRHADAHNLTHCGSYAITDIEQADACVGDVLIQLAIWKEIVYG